MTEGGVGGAATAPGIPEARGFRPAGRVAEVESSSSPPFRNKKRRKGRRRQGQKYEARAHEEMQDRYGEDYVPSPWFRYREADSPKWYWCQPDGLLLLPALRRLIVLEYKLQHTAQAYWQIELLYRRILEHVFLPAAWEICAVEVTRWYDRATPFPERPQLLPDPTAAEPGRFGVHIWDHRRRTRNAHV